MCERSVNLNQSANSFDELEFRPRVSNADGRGNVLQRWSSGQVPAAAPQMGYGTPARRGGRKVRDAQRPVGLAPEYR